MIRAGRTLATVRLPTMRRIERRILRISDELEQLREQVRLTEEELRIHQHLDDDARRDAAVGGPIEREDARITSGDVNRFERLLVDLRSQESRLEEQRRRLVDRM
ncbi:MAG: hypothetical protein WD652_03110 [Acidimicrobiia bacterium]